MCPEDHQLGRKPCAQFGPMGHAFGPQERAPKTKRCSEHKRDALTKPSGCPGGPWMPAVSPSFYVSSRLSEPGLC